MICRRHYGRRCAAWQGGRGVFIPGFEGVLTAFERGDLPDWHRVFLAYRDDATGNVRAFVHEALDALEQGDIRPELAPVFRLAVAPFDAAV